LTTRHVHVLLVEDDRSLRSVLARNLALRGFRIEEAATGEEAASALDDGLRADLVLLDLNLPGRTGWDLLRGPELARAGNPPVVVMTATAVDPRRLATFEVAGYLPKPFAMDTLVATVERFVGVQP
jgi:DNA-binding response OmpR family regulator